MENAKEPFAIVTRKICRLLLPIKRCKILDCPFPVRKNSDTFTQVCVKLWIYRICMVKI